jgi:hypothetical protein
MFCYEKVFQLNGFIACTHQAFLCDDLVQGFKVLRKLRFIGIQNDLQQTLGAWKIYCFSIDCPTTNIHCLENKEAKPLYQKLPWKIYEINNDANKLKKT